MLTTNGAAAVGTGHFSHPIRCDPVLYLVLREKLPHSRKTPCKHLFLKENLEVVPEQGMGRAPLRLCAETKRIDMTMMNLLQETREAIASSGHSENDIIFIGSEETGHQCTWAEFCVIADVRYNNRFGRIKIAGDLILVFKDGQKLWRGEYAGSEWWEYSKPFKRPETALPIRKLRIDQRLYRRNFRHDIADFNR